MVKESNYLIAEREDGISYVVGGNYLYVSGGMYQLEEIQPYITGKRGIYVLIGRGTYYVGEGIVSDRLRSHRRNKVWVEDVYVVVKGGHENMDKEESLRFEGSLNTNIKLNTNLKQDNKDQTREDNYNISEHLKRLKWLGIELPRRKTHNITKKDGYELKVLQKEDLQYEIISVDGNLKWLEGQHFEELKEVISLVEALDEGVDKVWR